MKISEILPSKTTYCKSVKIRKQGCDIWLLKIIVKEIEKSFLHQCKNMENWKLDVKTDKEHVYLDLSCQANKEEENINERV